MKGTGPLSVLAASKATEVPRTTIRAWIADKAIQTTPDGRIPRSELTTIRRLRASQERAGVGPSPRTPDATGSSTGGAPSADPHVSSAASVKHKLNRAKLRRERAMAELAELRAAHQRGDYLLREAVVRDAHACAERLRALLSAVADRVSLAAAMRSAPEVRDAVDREIQSVIAQAQSEFMGGMAA